MKVKKLVLTCLLAGMSVAVQVQAQNKLPQGKWEVKQVRVEKNTDGKIDTAVYNAANEVKSFVICPKEWTITEQSIIWRYSNDIEITVEYALDGDRFTIVDVSPMQLYHYSVEDDVLVLTIAYNVNNPPMHMNEKWTIILKQK